MKKTGQQTRFRDDLRRLLLFYALLPVLAAVLLLIATDKAVTQRDVARQLGFNESAMTAMVRRLIDMGMLERTRDEDDARAWRLRPSDRGRAALKRIQPPFERINRTIESVLTPDEITQMADCLARLATAFDAS